VFWDIIYELAGQGTTIVVTTHYMDEAAKCQRLGFMSKGKLIANGTQDDILRQFNQPTVEDVFVWLQRQDEGVAA
jgi:ABC-2 type transport system ATP-binding protein